MKSLQQWKRLYAEELGSLYDQRELPQIFSYVMEQMNISRMDLVLRANDIPTATEQLHLARALDRLKAGEPVQYVTGKAFFKDHWFHVDSTVLIPRPETEELVEWVLSSSDLQQPLKVLDIGTGSGCIAISLALAGKNWLVFATDASAEALDTAVKNSEALQSNELKCLQWDVFSPYPSNIVDALDIIISNPPYIPIAEQSQMHRRVTAHEPEMALFVPTDDPLLFYRRIAELGKQKLKKGGALYFEIHEKLAQEVIALLHTFEYTEIACRKDLQNKDRMIRAIC